MCRDLVLMRERPRARAGPDRRGADARQRRARSTTSRPTCSSHAAAGHMTVVPVRAATGRTWSRRRRPRSLRRRSRALRRAARSLALHLLAPLVGSTSHQPARASSTRSIPWADNVDAQIFFVARLPRVLAGGAGRRDAGRGGRGASRRCCAIRWPRRSRWASRRAPRWARCSRITLRLDVELAGRLVRAARQLRRRARRRGHRLLPGRVARHRGLSTNVLLLAGVTLNSFFSALILFVQYLADFAETFRRCAG